MLHGIPWNMVLRTWNMFNCLLTFLEIGTKPTGPPAWSKIVSFLLISHCVVLEGIHNSFTKTQE